MTKTLNKVQLIGRLGSDPEMRHTASGMAVATFSLATNRQWKDADGALQEEAEWHTVVAWDKLAQVCNEYLGKGRLVYIEGRLRTRSWESSGQKHSKTEIVASDMLILDSKNPISAPEEKSNVAQPAVRNAVREVPSRYDAPIEESDDLPF